MMYCHVVQGIAFIAKNDMKVFLLGMNEPQPGRCIFTHGTPYGNLLIHVGHGYCLNGHAPYAEYYQQIVDILSKPVKKGIIHNANSMDTGSDM